MGKPRRYMLDMAIGNEDAPAIDEVLRGPRVDHLIVDVWPTDSKVWPNRWTCTIRSLGPHDGCPRDDGRRVRPVTTYRRGEGPHDHFGERRTA